MSRGGLRGSTRSRLKGSDKPPFAPVILKHFAVAESNQIARRVNRIREIIVSLASRAGAIVEGATLRPGRAYCVFATRGGVACVTNCVASIIAVPSGVGTTKRNGTRMRVPASGAKAISMLR
jgi:hypothetical protein